MGISQLWNESRNSYYFVHFDSCNPNPLHSGPCPTLMQVCRLRSSPSSLRMQVVVIWNTTTLWALLILSVCLCLHARELLTASLSHWGIFNARSATMALLKKKKKRTSHFEVCVLYMHVELCVRARMKMNYVFDAPCCASTTYIICNLAPLWCEYTQIVLCACIIRTTLQLKSMLLF